MQTAVKNDRPITRATWLNLGDAYAYIYCLMMSYLLVGVSVPGGALYMCGRVASMLFSGTWGEYNRLISKRTRIISAIGLTVLMLVSALVAVFYPVQEVNSMMWLLFAAILTMTIGDILGWRLVHLSLNRGMEEKRFIFLYAAVQAVPFLVGAGLLLGSVSGVEGWMAVGGLALATVAICYGQLKQRRDAGLHSQVKAEDAANLHEQIRKANAYANYETISGLILMAQQMTIVVMYTFPAITSEKMLISMALAMLCTLVCREATEWIMAHREKKKASEPINLLLIGLFLWLYGLILFSRLLRSKAMTISDAYLCMGLCTAGSTVCTTCLSHLESVMNEVACFATGEMKTTVYDRMRLMGSSMAVLAGQMLALAALTLLMFMGSQRPEAETLVPQFQPIMVIPALILVIVAVGATLRFPLSKRYMDKLRRFLHLKEAGGNNPALEKQLETVVIKRHHYPIGIRLVRALLRPFYRHKLQGTENIVQDDNNPIVFLCNHGEVYGPVVCIMYIPVPIRPWTISEMSIDPEEVSEYLYRYTIGPIRWLPEKVKRWITHIIGPVSVWAMEQVECVPVFRNKPSKLMQTFRLSVEAMEAGDNLLIFPENPNAIEDGKGYELGGLGPLFSGFAMLAQIYYNRTGKCCRFLPMYAHKKQRTMTFAPPITYDPNNDPMAERDRIVQYADSQMRRIAEEEEAKWQAKQRGKGQEKKEKA